VSIISIVREAEPTASVDHVTVIFFSGRVSPARAASAKASTIIKLSLSNDTSPDVGYNGGVFSTLDDGVGGTVGDQNTGVDFLDFLSPHHANIASGASYSLVGVNAVGPATNLPGVALQSFTGGDFFLYDPANALLLSGHLGGSSLFGTVGPPSTGAFFSVTFANVTGGSLAPFIAPGSLSLSISMTDVRTGGVPGSGLQAPQGVLLPFVADVTQTIAGEAPEPSSVLLAILGGVLVSAYSVRRKIS